MTYSIQGINTVSKDLESSEEPEKPPIQRPMSEIWSYLTKVDNTYWKIIGCGLLLLFFSLMIPNGTWLEKHMIEIGVIGWIISFIIIRFQPKWLDRGCNAIHPIGEKFELSAIPSKDDLDADDRWNWEGNKYCGSCGRENIWAWGDGYDRKTGKKLRDLVCSDSRCRNSYGD